MSQKTNSGSIASNHVELQHTNNLTKIYLSRENMSIFDKYLGILEQDIDLSILMIDSIEWMEYIINPRRLRGSDFVMRWEQGRWSEERIIQAVNDTGKYFALPYGPSGTAPKDDISEVESYFDRLEKAGLGKMKRPDLLIFRIADKSKIDHLVKSLGGLAELPFQPENDSRMLEIIAYAILAVECENSLWIAKKMPGYGTELKPQRKPGKKPGPKKGAVVPTVILKEEDVEPLVKWQETHKVPVHIWHVFYDLAFGISLDKAIELIKLQYIKKHKQTFQAPSGAITSKIIYRIYYHYCYEVGETIDEPMLVAKSIIDKNGHVLPYVKFEGGTLKLSHKTRDLLDKLAGEKGL
jgi:hypothetical protein